MLISQFKIQHSQLKISSPWPSLSPAVGAGSLRPSLGHISFPLPTLLGRFSNTILALAPCPSYIILQQNSGLNGAWRLLRRFAPRKDEEAYF